MKNSDTITKFYTAFSAGDSNGMVECYHENIVFKDPVFGTLKGQRAAKMWQMLLAQKNSDTTITFEITETTADTAKANWVATYNYGKKKRKVVNKVSADFKFKDGKIIAHTDTFDLWKWTKQAMGAPGYLMGWTGFMKSKIQKTTNKRLDAFIKKTQKG